MRAFAWRMGYSPKRKIDAAPNSATSSWSAEPAPARPTSPSPSPEAACEPVRAAGSSPPSTRSTASSYQPAPAVRRARVAGTRTCPSLGCFQGGRHAKRHCVSPLGIPQRFQDFVILSKFRRIADLAGRWRRGRDTPHSPTIRLVSIAYSSRWSNLCITRVRGRSTGGGSEPSSHAVAARALDGRQTLTHRSDTDHEAATPIGVRPPCRSTPRIIHRARRPTPRRRSRRAHGLSRRLPQAQTATRLREKQGRHCRRNLQQRGRHRSFGPQRREAE
jgi:hypothetical protein